MTAGMCLGQYDNLDVICNAKYDSIIYDLVSQPAGIKEGLPNMGDAFLRRRALHFSMNGLEIITYTGCLPSFSTRGKKFLPCDSIRKNVGNSSAILGIFFLHQR